MPGDISFDLGTALPYVEEKIRAMFGRDAATLEEKNWLADLHATALELSSRVQCIGMPEPLRFEEIYQPTKLRMRSGFDITASAAFGSQNRAAQSIALSRSQESHVRSVTYFLESPENAIVFAGPGWGKTTFMHHVFRAHLTEPHTFVVLFTLRRPLSVDGLERFVKLCHRPSWTKKNGRILLLVDGYDEVSLEEQRRVSEALLTFAGTRTGRYILSCRDYYTVIGLNASHVFIESFDKQDKYRFVSAFLKAFSSKLDATALVNELEDRALTDFLSHPLLLALTCILKIGQNPEEPRSALRLLERALTVLQYTWDASKGIHRQRLTNLDASDRMQILKRIAFASRSPFLETGRVQTLTQRELDRMTISRTDPALVLQESAQFYGILVQSRDGWEFVHRSIQDYLAAKYWVETGAFANVQAYEWTTRTAYAACISHDATEVFRRALAAKAGETTAAEILSNAPNFDQQAVMDALIEYYSKQGRTIVYDSQPDLFVSGEITFDLLKLLSNKAINCFVEACCAKRTNGNDVLMGYCLLELRKRLQRLEYVTFDKLAKAIANVRFQFRLSDGGFVTPEMVRPWR